MAIPVIHLIYENKYKNSKIKFNYNCLLLCDFYALISNKQINECKKKCTIK